MVIISFRWVIWTVGIIKNSDFSRVSARMNTDFNLLDGMLTIGRILP